jgi:hypothetical protein
MSDDYDDTDNSNDDDGMRYGGYDSLDTWRKAMMDSMYPEGYDEDDNRDD